MDIWIRNQIAHLADVTSDLFASETKEPSAIGWVNGNDYERSQETFGVLAIPAVIKTKYGMHSYSQPFAVGENVRYAHLAKQQDTLIAVLPVSTAAEYHMFRLLRRQHGSLFTEKTQPDWVELARIWNNHSDGRDIFYTVSSFLSR